jgi:transposase InsO family protein
MRENGLNARLKQRFIPATNSNHGLPVCENLLNRRFHAAGPGEKWVSSYQRYAVTYPRPVGGWALSADMETVHTAIPAVNTAFSNRKAGEGLTLRGGSAAVSFHVCPSAFGCIRRLTMTICRLICLTQGKLLNGSNSHFRKQ